MSGTFLVERTMIIVALLSPAITSAGEPKSDVKGRNKLALKAAASGKFDEAVLIWEGLLGEVSVKTALGVRANLAVAYRELGDLPSAWYNLTWYLKHSKNKDLTAGEELQLLEKDLTGAGFVRIAIACEPAKSVIYLGKVEHGKPYDCPLAWWMTPGKTWVTVSSKGYQTKSAELDIRERGDDTAHHIRLTEIAPRSGELVVDGKGRAIQVFLDGALEGSVPFRRKLKPGDYELMVGKPGQMPWKKKVTIVAGVTLVERPPLAQPQPEPTKVVEGDSTSFPDKTIAETRPAIEKGSKAWKWALLGSGVAMIGGGGVMSYLAAGAYDDARKEHMLPYYELSAAEQKLEYNGMRADFEDDVNANVQPKLVSSYVMYGIGGAAAAAGAALLAWDMVSDDPSQVSLVPTLNGNHGGFALSLSF